MALFSTAQRLICPTCNGVEFVEEKTYVYDKNIATKLIERIESGEVLKCVRCNHLIDIETASYFKGATIKR